MLMEKNEISRKILKLQSEITFAILNGHKSHDGDKFEKTTADSVQISDQSGLHAFYFDDDTLRTVFNPNAGQVDNVIRTKAIIGYVYWNTVDDSMYYHGDERHGILMSTSTHSYLHFSFGKNILI